MASPFAEKARRIREIVKQFIQSAPDELYAFTIEQMGEDIGSSPFVAQSEGPLNLRAPRNNTNKLRFQTNTLGRALAPREKGNISKVDVVNDRLEIKYGIDKDVVPYAAIHEYGGTIKHPGGTPYVNIGGRTLFVRKENADKNMRTTKPHNIEMPARPYLRPGFAAFSKQQIPRLLDRIRKELGS